MARVSQQQQIENWRPNKRGLEKLLNRITARRYMEMPHLHFLFEELKLTKNIK